MTVDTAELRRLLAEYEKAEAGTVVESSAGLCRTSTRVVYERVVRDAKRRLSDAAVNALLELLDRLDRLEEVAGAARSFVMDGDDREAGPRGDAARALARLDEEIPDA